MTLVASRRAKNFLDRLASVPADPEDARAFFQRRLRAFARILGVLWLLTWPVDYTITLFVSSQSFLAITLEWFGFTSTWLHLGTALLLVGTSVLLRKRTYAPEWLVRLDVVVTLAQCITLAMFTLISVALFRPELGTTLGVAHILAIRAAMIPSSPRRTAVISVVASLAIIASTVGMTLMAKEASMIMHVSSVVVWCSITVTTSTLISAVIYGLRDRVRAAREVGQYTLVEKIGEGGMGRVYRARHALLRRPTAIKIMLSDRTTEDDVRRFEREVQLTSQLNHPNIIAVYDFGRSPGGVFYYAMEFLDGVDLQLLVETEGPQPESRVLHLFKQAADALADAHAIGLIHRDIKPANMILCQRKRHSDQLKICDFGLVKRLSANSTAAGSELNVLKGTPLYMAPESIMTPEEVDARTDLYALGAVAFFLLTGKPVFDGSNIVEVCGKHIHQPIPSIEERGGQKVSEQLEAVIRKCLAKKKDDRFADAGELLDALLRIDDVPAWSDREAETCWTKSSALLQTARRRAVPQDEDRGRQQAFHVSMPEAS